MTFSSSSPVETAATEPIWLLDVDGVLNAVTADVPDGYKQTRSDRWGIVYHPAVIERIAELHRGGVVEVRWLTTWCERAAEILAPDLSLPYFKVEGADLHAVTPEPNGWWKSAAAQRVSEAEPHRALIWTDDDLEDAEANGEVDWLRDRTAGTLALSCNWRTGLTSANLDRIEKFCERQAVLA